MKKSFILLSAFIAILGINASLYAQPETIITVGGDFKVDLFQLYGTEFNRPEDRISGWNIKASTISNYRLGRLYSLGYGVYGIFQSNTSLDLQNIYAAYLAPVFYQRLMFLDLISMHLGLGPLLGISFVSPVFKQLNQKNPGIEYGLFVELGIGIHISENFGLGITRTLLFPTGHHTVDTISLGVNLIFQPHSPGLYL